MYLQINSPEYHQHIYAHFDPCDRRAGIEPDHVYTSFLKRAIKTAWLALGQMGREFVGETRAWQLNERMYGLAGLTPQEAYAKYVSDG